MKVGYVCTSYNNSNYTRGAIASLHRSGRAGDVRVVVVDNCSADADVESLKELAREFPGVQLVLNTENVGYFPGLNIGIRRMRASFPDVEHMAVGNNDLEFPAKFVESLERYRNVLDEWAVVAPDLVTPAGVHQNPHVRFPISRLRKTMWDLYFLSYGTAVVLKQAIRITKRLHVRAENHPASDLYRTAGAIEQGYGACYLIGPAFFRHFSQFFAPTFMMQEEFFLGEQLKGIGQQMYYDPRLVVLHHGHATTDQLPSRRQWSIGRAAHGVYKRYLAMSPTEQRDLIAGIGSGQR